MARGLHNSTLGFHMYEKTRSMFLFVLSLEDWGGGGGKRAIDYVHSWVAKFCQSRDTA